MTLTCRSCLHSIGSYPGSPLICTRTMQAVPKTVCEAFEYEPGTSNLEYDEDPQPETNPCGGR